MMKPAPGSQLGHAHIVNDVSWVRFSDEGVQLCPLFLFRDLVVYLSIYRCEYQYSYLMNTPRLQTVACTYTVAFDGKHYYNRI
jgi:hypothetical protein